MNSHSRSAAALLLAGACAGAVGVLPRQQSGVAAGAVRNAEKFNYSLTFAGIGVGCQPIELSYLVKQAAQACYSRASSTGFTSRANSSSDLISLAWPSDPKASCSTR